MDALPIIGPAKDIAVIGWGQSQLDDYIKDAAAAAGPHDRARRDAGERLLLPLRPAQLRAARRARAVCAIRDSTSSTAARKPAARLYADYTANRYHKPADEYDPNWDFRGVIEDVKAFYAVGKRLADETTFPHGSPTPISIAPRRARRPK